MDAREEKFWKIIECFDYGSDLLERYDGMTHLYGKEVLYQAEAHFIQTIGRNPNITATELAAKTGKTISACSQMVHKLQKRGLLVQTRNENNNRQYYINLTEYGKEIFDAHEALDNRNLLRRYDMLEEFSEQDFDTYVAIQNILNAAMEDDIRASQSGRVVEIIKEGGRAETLHGKLDGNYLYRKGSGSNRPLQSGDHT